jgi:DNA-binding NarL/FixJ family response regulator
MAGETGAAVRDGDPVRVLVATDEPLLRAGLLHALRGHPWVQVVGWGHRPEGIRRLVAETGAEVVVCALGAAAVARLTAAAPRTPVLALRDADGAADHPACGAAGVLSRQPTVDELVAALLAVRVGLVVRRPTDVESPGVESPGVASPGEVEGAPEDTLPVVVDLVEHDTVTGEVLTPRERQVVQLLVDGLSVKQVASRLGIAMQTAKNHIHHVMGKVGASTRLQLYAWAKENGFSETQPLAPTGPLPRRNA